MKLLVKKIFLLLSLHCLCFLFLSNLNAQNTTYSIFGPDKVKRGCDKANVGIKLDGFKQNLAPFSIHCTVNGVSQSASKTAVHKDIPTTFVAILPSGPSTIDIGFIVYDNAGVKILDTHHEIIKTNQFFCDTPRLEHVTPSYPSDLKMFGEQCSPKFKLGYVGDWALAGFSNRCRVRVYNNQGQILMNTFRSFGFFGDIELGVLPHVTSLNPFYKVTPDIYIEVTHPFIKNVIYVQKVNIFKNQIIELENLQQECIIPTSAQYAANAYEIPGSPYDFLSLDIDPICIIPDPLNPTDVEGFSVGYSTSSSWSWEIGIEIPISSQIEFLKGAGITSYSVSQEVSVDHSKNYKISEERFCEMCDEIPEEDLKPNQKCNTYRNDANSFIPRVVIYPRKRVNNNIWMDCQGEVKSDILTTHTNEIQFGWFCEDSNESCNSCSDKEPADRREFPSTNNGNSGYIYAEMKNGTPPFDFQWTKKPLLGKENGSSSKIYGAPVEIPNTREVITDLTPGIYQYIITDSECCEVDGEIEITCEFEMDVTVTVAECSGGAIGGSISLFPLSTAFPITYEWNTGDETYEIENLSAGVYTVTATDADGCVFIDSIAVSQESTTEITESITNASLCGNDGSIELTVTGKGNSFTYSWTNGASSQNISNLSAGSYCVTVTDAAGCLAVECYTVEKNPSMDITLDAKPACGSNNGIIEATVTGGAEPYTYQWNNGQTGNIVTNLSAGTYVVVVTDATGCEALKAIVVNGSSEMIIVTSSDMPCSGQGGYAQVIVSGGTPPYSYLWDKGAQTDVINNLTPGYYSVEITDSNGCSETVDFDLNYTVELSMEITTSPVITGCDNVTGSVNVTAVGGKVPLTYRLDLGSTNIEHFTTDQSSHTFENVEANANYSVAIFDACNNNIIEENIEVDSVENAKPFEIATAIPNSTCSDYLGTGSIDLVMYPEGEYEYQWSNGSTTQDLNNLTSGFYDVTVTNIAGCEKHERLIEVTLLPYEFDFDINTTNSCGDLNNGSAEVIINDGGDYEIEWNTGETTFSIEGLFGTYQFSLTNSLGCTETVSFYVGNSEDLPIDIEVNIERQWNYNGNSNSNAVVHIQSDQFEEGGKVLLVDENVTKVIYNQLNPLGTIFSIPPNDYDQFHVFEVIYTSPQGCKFNQYFTIPLCYFPDAGLVYDVEHLNDSESFCGVGQENSYQISVNNAGNNSPYFIEVTMKEAVDESEEDFRKIVPYTGINTFIIEGIPDGIVQFEVIDNCQSQGANGVTHRNCCIEFTCEQISQSYFIGQNEDHDVESYSYPFVKLRVEEPCYDANGCGIINDGIWDNFCSKVHVLPKLPKEDLWCWGGTVDIGFPDGSHKVFEVFNADQPSPGTTYGINWISGEDEDPWEPPSVGSHIITISYTGTGDTQGQNCFQEVEINFYGENSAYDIIGFNDDFWFDGEDLGIPDLFMNSYFSAWRCGGKCGSDAAYVYNNDQDKCESVDNWLSTYFKFTPNDYSNPCSSGGLITIMDFDSNGAANVIQNVEVPAHTPIGELNGQQPIGNSVETWCSKSGWCLFDAEKIYGFQMNKPLLASWSDPNSCKQIVFNDPEVMNSDPCETDGDCPIGFICGDDGNCYQLCPEGECLFGECINGICVEGLECDNCPPDFECIQGDCYWPDELCDFSVSVEGGSGTNIYEVYHELQPGTNIVFKFNTLTREDEISIYGSGINDIIHCIGTNGWDEEIYQITGGNKVTIKVKPCETGSRYHLKAECLGGITNNSNSSTARANSNIPIMSSIEMEVVPNPFATRFSLIVKDVITEFTGNVEFYDNLGRQVFNKKLTFKAGVNSFDLSNIENLKNGIYIVLIKNNNTIISSKRIVKAN